MQNFQIVGTFFALWLTVQFAASIEDVFAYVIIFTVGLLHGANDIRLIQKRQTASDFNFLKTLSLYITLVLLTAGIFFLIPTVALAIFILLSSYHFGEEHWKENENVTAWSHGLFFTSYGALILCSLFYFNSTDTQLIILEITGYTISSVSFAWMFFTSSFLTALFYVVRYSDKFVWAELIEELFYILLLFTVFRMATLLWGFAIYFVLWHSLPSLKNQLLFLFQEASLKSFYKYIRASFVYWFVSILGIGGLYFFFGTHKYLFKALIFAFIAAITFPHVWVMFQIKKNG